MRPLPPALKTVFRLIALVFAFLQAWAYRFYIEPDGVNYLDIADAYLRRDWRSAINGYWSPLYSWLLAGMKWLFHPSAYWESTALHLLNFVLFLLALLSFEFFFRKLLALLAERYPDPVEGQGLPAWAWWALGYAAFLIVSLKLITLSNDSPDMGLATLLFLAAALLLDITARPAKTLRHAALGAVLGFAYLAKAVMFPLSFVYIGASLFARYGWKKPDFRAIAGLAAFLVVSSPFAIALSRAKGHFTFGETGRMAYLAQVTQRTEPGLPQLVKRLCQSPTIYEYEAPFMSTYPPWHDSSYWWAGVTLRFSLYDQLRAIGRSATNYFRILSIEKEWIAGFLVLAIFACDWSTLAKRWLALWFLWLPSLAMLFLYSLVLVEQRYVAVALGILCISLFAALPWLEINLVPRLGPAVVLAIAITSSAALCRELAPDLITFVRPPAHKQWMAAVQLRRLNFPIGERFAVLGHTTVADYWAHVGGYTIVADVPLEAVQSYWNATPKKRAEISSTLAAAGVKAVVSASQPPIPDGWQPLGNSGYYVNILLPPDAIR